MSINSIGLERLCEVQDAVRDAGRDASVVIDSDDLVARPEATMAALYESAASHSVVAMKRVPHCTPA